MTVSASDHSDEPGQASSRERSARGLILWGWFRRRPLLLTAVLGSVAGFVLFQPFLRCESGGVWVRCTNLVGMDLHLQAYEPVSMTPIPGLIGAFVVGGLATATTASIRERLWWLTAAIGASVIVFALLHPYRNCMETSDDPNTCKNLVGQRVLIRDGAALDHSPALRPAAAAGAIAGLTGLVLMGTGKAIRWGRRRPERPASPAR